MDDKLTTKKNIKQIDRVVKIKTRELNALKSLFSLRGTKSDFENKFNMQRQSVLRIINAGKGTERIVNAMRKYYEANK